MTLSINVAISNRPVALTASFAEVAHISQTAGFCPQSIIDDRQLQFAARRNA